MCKSFGDECEKCPAFNACEDELCSCAVDVESPMDAVDQIAIVEEWAKEHPRKTRQSKFLEQYPEADLNALGVISICPLRIIKLMRIPTEFARLQAKHAMIACRNSGVRK